MAAKNFGWEKIEGTNDAEKTVSFGNNPLKTHRLYGKDEKDLQRQIKEFEARLEAVNGPEPEAEASGDGEAAEVEDEEAAEDGEAEGD